MKTMILGVDCSRMSQENPTGVEHYTNHLVKGLVESSQKLGYQSIRLYVKNAQQLQQLLQMTERNALCEVVLISTKRLWTLWGLSKELFKRPVDVLFVPSHVLPLVVPQKSFLTVHGVEALLYPKAYTFFQRWYQRFGIWWASKKKAECICVSQAVKSDVQRFFHFQESQMHVVYNGFQKPSDEQLDQKSDLKNFSFLNHPYVLNVGRLESRKNQSRLIKAFEGLADEFADLQLVLVGPDGVQAKAIKEQVKNSDVSSRMYLLGYQSQPKVYALMKHAEIFAYPSLAEGFGIPLLEAFSQQVPVLTSKGSACQEVAGQAALLCDPTDVQSLSEGLKTLLKDQALRERLVQKGLERVGDFSWEKCIQLTLDVLKKRND